MFRWSFFSKKHIPREHLTFIHWHVRSHGHVCSGSRVGLLTSLSPLLSKRSLWDSEEAASPACLSFSHDSFLLSVLGFARIFSLLIFFCPSLASFHILSLFVSLLSVCLSGSLSPVRSSSSLSHLKSLLALLLLSFGSLLARPPVVFIAFTCCGI